MESRKILVVEDSRALTNMIRRKLENDLPVIVDITHSLEETRDLLEVSQDYMMAVLDLNLPDAPNGEVVDYVSSKNIPAVVLTGSFNPSVRQALFSKNVIDYLVKESRADLEHISALIRSLSENKDIKILVVDDSRVSRYRTAALLKRRGYQVLEAEDGVVGRQVAEKEHVQLVITDYNMPEADGFELVKNLRQTHGKDVMSIIGLSSEDDSAVSAGFLKLGANDFLKKPFSVEEFFCRVSQNLELLHLITRIREQSNSDHLTGLFNRRYFFQNGRRIYRRSLHGKKSLAIAMIDIDHFKKINDSYGHDGGDEVLRTVARTLSHCFRPGDLLARFGGEEFCIMMQEITADQALEKLEEVRKGIAQLQISYGKHTIGVTISVGLCTQTSDDLEAMIKEADLQLYKAKEGGRNQVRHLG